MIKEKQQPKEKKERSAWRFIGPGIVLAAAGVGAGDIVANGTAGASYGLILIWAILLGAFIKFVLNEGMARYQIATKKTFLQGINERSKFLTLYFIVYLAVWSFIVGGALLSSIGVATKAMIPGFSTIFFGIINAIIVLAIILFGKYKVFEKIMKIFALLMFLGFLISAIAVFPGFLAIIKGFIPLIPVQTTFWKGLFDTLAVIGGVGATVTIMAYSYWIREKNWIDKKLKTTIRIDLAIGYIITAIFGISVMIVAAAVLHPQGIALKGSDGILMLANSLTTALGPAGFWIFIIGFYSAIISSLFSFYQAIPYLFADSVALFIKKPFKSHKQLTKSWLYKGYMLYNVFPPMILLWLEKPISLVKSYTVLGAFFMPFMALMLLMINNRKEMKDLKNKLITNIFLVGVLLLFAAVSIYSFVK